MKRAGRGGGDGWGGRSGVNRGVGPRNLRNWGGSRRKKCGGSMGEGKETETESPAQPKTAMLNLQREHPPTQIGKKSRGASLKKRYRAEKDLEAGL